MICACILTNGIRDTIADAIRSVLPLVDRVLLVDTGITDDTITVAKEVAGDRLIVEQFTWCNDFAAARNFCLEAVRRAGGEWYLMLDSDEQFSITEPHHVRANIDSSPTMDCWLIADASGTYFRERLVRVSSAARWHGRTHESLIGVPAQRKRTLPGVTVSSRPKSPEAFRAKLERDLAALRIETTELPADPRWWYYLGQTLEDLGQHAEAIAAYSRCASLPGWSEQAAWACYRSAVCHAALRWHFEALAVCCAGLARDGRFPELAWFAGWNCYQLDRKPEAAAWARAALAITGSGVCESRIGFRFLPGWRDRPNNLLKWCASPAGLACDPGPRGKPGPSAPPNIIVMGVGHANTTITARQLHAMGWHAWDADSGYAESVSIRAINHSLLNQQIVGREEMDSALAAMPQPWAVKDPRFAYGTLHDWLPAFEQYRPMLLWVTKDRSAVEASYARRGESTARLDEHLVYCESQYANWPWAKLTLDASEIGAACELWRSA